jgi:hypothetical protein
LEFGTSSDPRSPFNNRRQTRDHRLKIDPRKREPPLQVVERHFV